MKKSLKILVLFLVIIFVCTISFVVFNSNKLNISTSDYIGKLYDKYLSNTPKNCYMIKEIKIENDTITPYVGGDDDIDLSEIKINQSAKITVEAMNLSDYTINDVKFLTSLTYSENGEYLLIDKPIIHIDSLNAGNGSLSGIFEITVTAVNNLDTENFFDIVISELYIKDERQDCDLFGITIKQ